VEASPSRLRGERRTATASLFAIAFGLAALGLILGLALDPAWFAVWGLALAAFGFAIFAGSSRGPTEASAEPRAGESTDAGAGGPDAVHDPTRNPYGRPE
jgi:hypothetical protein